MPAHGRRIQDAGLSLTRCGTEGSGPVGRRDQCTTAPSERVLRPTLALPTSARSKPPGTTRRIAAPAIPVAVHGFEGIAAPAIEQLPARARARRQDGAVGGVE